MKIKYKGKTYKLKEKYKNFYLALALIIIILITGHLDYIYTLN